MSPCKIAYLLARQHISRRYAKKILTLIEWKTLLTTLWRFRSYSLSLLATCTDELFPVALCLIRVCGGKL